MLEDEDYIYDLAKDMLAVGKVEHALSLLLPATEAADVSPRILWLAGHIATNTWRGALAVSLLERARRQVPNSSTVVADLIRALTIERRTREALALGRESLPIVEQPLQVLMAMAMVELTELSPESARAFVAHPDADLGQGDSQAIRAILAIHDGDWDTARTASTRLLRLSAEAEMDDAVRRGPETPPHYLGPAPRSPAAEGTRIALATSLSPRGGPAQRDAISTWATFADSLMSVNTAPEIAALKPEYPDVAFVETTRDGRDLVGKPLVYLDSILDALEGADAAICGIVNADIRLLDAHRLRREVLDTATGALTLCHRIDLGSDGTTEGAEYLSGFDAFFFPRERIPLFRGSRLLLGAPWWDYLLPLLALVGDLPVRIPWRSSIGHVAHPINWSMPLFNRSGQLFVEAMVAKSRATPALPPLAERFLAPILADFSGHAARLGGEDFQSAQSTDILRQNFGVLLTLLCHLIRTQAQRLGTPPDAE